MPVSILFFVLHSEALISSFLLKMSSVALSDLCYGVQGSSVFLSFQCPIS